VQPVIVVEVQIRGQAAASFFRVSVVVQVHLFIFDRAPQAFGGSVSRVQSQRLQPLDHPC
jgi:hypothetical protein